MDLKYYSTAILNNMTTIESITGMPFHQTYAEVTTKFWNAFDSKDLNKLKFLKNQTDKITDNLRSDT